MSETFCRLCLLKGNQVPGFLNKNIKIFQKGDQNNPIIIIDYPICDYHLNSLSKYIEKFGWIKKEDSSTK